jgi:hypothetical protein
MVGPVPDDPEPVQLIGRARLRRGDLDVVSQAVRPERLRNQFASWKTFIGPMYSNVCAPKFVTMTMRFRPDSPFVLLGRSSTLGIA